MSLQEKRRCEGPGGQRCGYSSEPRVKPSAGAVSQEAVCQVGHTESEVSEEQRGQRFPPGVLQEVCYAREQPRSRCFTSQLPSDHKDTERSGHTGTAVGDFLPSSNTRPLGCPLALADPSAALPPATSMIGPSWSLAKESSSLQTSSVEAQRAKVFHLKRSESRACSWPFSEGEDETNFQSRQREEPGSPGGDPALESSQP